uniref:DUF4246 domain-containing protein n=1 Tax=Globisporangium ultimum (strain ATCC 200006 / CBS 805.95 / DAOM BR144) TaxID=431595 RepID=K3W8K3_GLOUD
MKGKTKQIAKTPQDPEAFGDPVEQMASILFGASANITLKGKTVQVIVKVAEILLTPESPKYDGGSWHIEGTDAEQIVATGIYYFDSENIRDSRLSLRVNVDEPDRHKVEPFELNDPMVPGAHKILAFFLVDPEKTIPSTSVIPPQKQHWIDAVQEPPLKKLKLIDDAEQNVKGVMSSDGMTLE